MRVLIVGINYDPEPVGIGPYTSGTARALAAAGHEVEVLTGKPYYPAWKIDPAYTKPLYRSSIEDGLRVTRVPLYVPARDGGAKRIVHHASFAAALIPVAIRAAWRCRPDVVLVVAPSLISVPVARATARIAGARLWIHVQDFEVEAAFATKLLKADSVAGRAARRFEARQLTQADRVSTISPQMCQKLRQKGIPDARIVEFRNWAESDAVRPLDHVSAYRDLWGITTPHVAFYSGNIAHKQGIEIIVGAAMLLRHRDDISFVICGDGPNRAHLERLTAGLSSVHLHELQPRDRLSELLGLATIHLLPQIVGAADLVLPSKMANMLASGRPVVATAAPGTGLSNEVDGVGLVTPPGDARAFAAAIEKLLDAPQERERLGREARQRAEQRWSREQLLAGFVASLDGLERRK